MSMRPLCAILGRELWTQGRLTLRTNVCREVLLKTSDGSTEHLYPVMFDYAKTLAA